MLQCYLEQLVIIILQTKEKVYVERKLSSFCTDKAVYGHGPSLPAPGEPPLEE
jgi:hypothetical protein